jgi:nucleotide sugar dehydrogenase
LGKKLKNKKKYFVVVVRSTVLPGTTEYIVIPILEKESGKKAGVDFGVAMNPEYLREKNAEDDFQNPWIITIGSLDRKSRNFKSKIYQKFDCPIHHLSLREAETQKYVHNLFNAVKIAFFNEMRMVCDSIGISPEKIFEITVDSAEGSWNKKYGIGNFGPFDGMCLPKDTQAFLNWSKKNKLQLDVLEGAIKSNKKFEIFWKKQLIKKSKKK